MKNSLVVLLLALVVPVFSVGGFNDCDKNCLSCEGKKCRQCKEGYAITKIYTRRKCKETCRGYQEKIWDPVLQSYICDTKIDCAKSSIRNCVECVGDSCVKCRENFALRRRDGMWVKRLIGLNVCCNRCESCTDPKSGVKVCRIAGEPCAVLDSDQPTDRVVTTTQMISTTVPSGEPEPTSATKEQETEWGSTPSAETVTYVASTSSAINNEPEEQNDDV